MNKKIVAIIQARMGSTRLPGKVLREVDGKPLLQYLIERVKSSKLIDKVVIATSNQKIDNKIESFCIKNEVECFRGSEDDVLLRYFDAAKFFNAQHIVRLCSDSPLIDCKLLDEMVTEYFYSAETCDYYSNTINQSYPLGMNIEIFNLLALEQANLLAEKKYEREHVTPYIYLNPMGFKIREKHLNGNYKHLRLTVDEEEDFLLIKKIIKALYSDDKFFGLDEIIELYKKDKKLFDLNSHIRQKTINN